VTPAGWADTCRELLGPADGSLLLVAPRTAAALNALFADRGATPADVPSGAVVVWLGDAAVPERRTAVLASLAARLPLGAPLIVVDHNQPRSAIARLANTVRLAFRGLPPARARYRVAREVTQVGFTVERLRLTDAERIQVVRAVRAG
jgi:hypothetical protein